MNERFSHLVWLGAGSASEPAGLLDVAEQVILVEAREAAYKSLQQQYPQASVQQQLISVDGGSVEFTEYNLAEYSAIHAATGLKAIFPGLKAVTRERLNAIRITDFINDLALQDHNNVLVIDIADSTLALLTALQQSGQLSQFSDMHIQAGIEPLYTGAATTTEITSFLQLHGYLLKQTAGDDPDLPWLSFSLNPLSQILQHKRKANDALNKELETLKQELTVQRQVSETLNSELEKVKQQFDKQAEQNQRDLLEKTGQLEAARLTADKEQAALIERFVVKNAELSLLTQQRDQALSQLSALQQQNSGIGPDSEQLKNDVQHLQAELANKAQQLSTGEQKHAELIDKLKSELELANKHAAALTEKIVQLEKTNQTLDETNVGLANQQQALKLEMLKAEAQIDIIKDLLLKQ